MGAGRIPHGSGGRRDHGGGAVRRAVVRADHIFGIAGDNMLGRRLRVCCTDRHGLAAWLSAL